MVDLFLHELENPEFWVAAVFCVVVLLLIRPIYKNLKEWSKGQAALIQSELDNAHQLRQEAEDLYAEYEKRTQNIDREHADILRSAEQEVVAIQKEADEKLSTKLLAKKKEVSERIQTIEANARKDLVESMMHTVMEKTKEIVSKQSIRQSESDMDRALEQVLGVLEKQSK